MERTLSDWIDDVMARRRQAVEIAARIQKDTDLLIHAHHDLEAALNRLIPAFTAWQSRLASATSVTATSSSTASRMPPVRLVRIADVADRLGGISRSQVWRMVKDKRFPKPRRLGLRAVGWLEQEVSAWIIDRPVFDKPRTAAPKDRP